jgi:transposase
MERLSVISARAGLTIGPGSLILPVIDGHRVSDYASLQRWTMTRATTAKKQSRSRYTDEFSAEALKLADTVGVSEAAPQLKLYNSQIYGWRAKAQLLSTRGQIDQAQSTEIARLKRQIADQAEEFALLKKASAYFAKHQK